MASYALLEQVTPSGSYNHVMRKVAANEVVRYLNTHVCVLRDDESELVFRVLRKCCENLRNLVGLQRIRGVNEDL